MNMTVNCIREEVELFCDNVSCSQDFAVEPDEQRMRKAAHLMVGSLAGSLALVTCRDPLRTSLTNRLRSLLAQGLDAAMLEQYVQVCLRWTALHLVVLGWSLAAHVKQSIKVCCHSCWT